MKKINWFGIGITTIAILGFITFGLYLYREFEAGNVWWSFELDWLQIYLLIILGAVLYFFYWIIKQDHGAKWNKNPADRVIEK